MYFFCSFSPFLLELFQYPWMVYHQKLLTSGVFLHDATMVSPLTLVFFGRKLIQKNEIINGQEISYVEVDSVVKFNCENQTQKVMKKLKLELDQILESKISSPGVTKWNETEGDLLKCIIKLLTSKVKMTELKE